jgi:hypothetical protein
MIVQALIDAIKVEIPDDVAAVLALLEYVIHISYDESHAQYCDVWIRRTESPYSEIDRVFNGAYHNTRESAINAMCEWVRAGCPSGHGEAMP